MVLHLEDSGLRTIGLADLDFDPYANPSLVLYSLQRKLAATPENAVREGAKTRLPCLAYDH